MLAPVGITAGPSIFLLLPWRKNLSCPGLSCAHRATPASKPLNIRPLWALGVFGSSLAQSCQLGIPPLLAFIWSLFPNNNLMSQDSV